MRTWSPTSKVRTLARLELRVWKSDARLAGRATREDLGVYTGLKLGGATVDGVFGRLKAGVLGVLGSLREDEDAAEATEAERTEPGPLPANELPSDIRPPVEPEMVLEAAVSGERELFDAPLVLGAFLRGS